MRFRTIFTAYLSHAVSAALTTSSSQKTPMTFQKLLLDICRQKRCSMSIKLRKIFKEVFSGNGSLQYNSIYTYQLMYIIEREMFDDNKTYKISKHMAEQVSTPMVTCPDWTNTGLYLKFLQECQKAFAQIGISAPQFQ